MHNQVPIFTMNEFLILVFILFFIAANFILALKFMQIFRKPDAKNKDSLFISIVVAAKNESNNIQRLISALKELEYPPDKYEVILVDDSSTDDTYKKIKEEIKDLNNFSLICSKGKKLPAKKGALELGINYAKNPFILITDADCIVERNWLRSYSNKFSEGYHFLFGPAPFLEEEESFISRLLCFENLRSTFLTFSAAEFRIPYSAAARNFGFIKSAFEKVGGYKNTLETLSGDDDLLLREAVKNKMKIGVVSGKKSFVYSEQKSSLKNYIDQKARHTETSLYYLPRQIIFLFLWHLTNLIFLFSPLLVYFEIFMVLLFPIKIITDIFIISLVQRYINYKFKIYHLIYLQIMYEIFLIINFFNALFRKPVWK